MGARIERWIIAAIGVGICGLALLLASQSGGVLGSNWRAECEDNWGAYFEERFYSEEEISDFVDACVEIAESWEDDGVPDETIRSSHIYSP